MKTNRILILISTLAVSIAMASSLHAQVTPLSIDFESPTYLTTMVPGDFAAEWSSVAAGTTITSTGALSGSQSLSIGAYSSARLYINAPNDASSLSLSMQMAPIDGGNFQTGGAIVLYRETDGDPESGNGESSALSLQFENGGSNPDTIRESIGNASSSVISTTWVSGTAYTININLDYVSAALSYEILNPGGSTLQSAAGSYLYHADQDFVLELHSNYSNPVLVDSIQITAVPEPSTYAVFAGLVVLGFVAWRRRRLQA